jgi:hypothetical protein
LAAGGVGRNREEKMKSHNAAPIRATIVSAASKSMRPG